jgi:hypothetical protein
MKFSLKAQFEAIGAATKLFFGIALQALDPFETS